MVSVGRGLSRAGCGCQNIESDSLAVVVILNAIAIKNKGEHLLARWAVVGEPVLLVSWLGQLD
ncbi:hypothetical protein H744_1c1015 [Photobacterium gaetbulicola Gung47]|uniref:Uncharacterized protein n=1 Tax=Photobacterium gaetbulicola Gung47 TaxID=658445 RepID=A0A0C5WSP0_9GAMM|nr:hypothetical protein H744_1c1015 [Photobacterium gaetbulicola Gung47]